MIVTVDLDLTAWHNLLQNKTWGKHYPDNSWPFVRQSHKQASPSCQTLNLAPQTNHNRLLENDNVFWKCLNEYFYNAFFLQHGFPALFKHYSMLISSITISKGKLTYFSVPFIFVISPCSSEFWAFKNCAVQLEEQQKASFASMSVFFCS